MGYVIAAVVLLAIFVIAGAILRKRIYNEVDRLGAWKIEIMNRPVADKIAKVKSLNMVGETEKKFDQWRGEWEQVVTIQLPNLEEKLFDAEEASDKYRFRKAKAILKDIQRELEGIEQQLDDLLQEVNEWVESEEKNRGDIVSLRESYRQGKQYLLTHYQSFGKAALLLEDAFQKVNEGFERYEEMTDEGNYLEARQVLLETKQLLVDTKEKMELIPELRVQLRSEIPAKLKELEAGMDDMESQGYVLDRRSLEKEMETIRNQLDHEWQNIEENNVKDAVETVDELHEKVDNIYDLLEKEVYAKQAVLKERERLGQQLESIQSAIVALKDETEIVALSYRIDDKDKQAQKELEKRLEKLTTRFLVVEDALSNQEQSYSSLLEMIEEIKERLENLQQHNDDYKQMLADLRKDELEAKETIKTLRNRLFSASRSIQKHNLPGVPESYVVMVEEAEEKIADVEEKLSEEPLDIPAVNVTLEKALETVEACLQTTNEMIEQALLTEKLIQYGNRYRSRSHVISAELQKAEDAFRRYDYETALETAARAIEPIDPDALKKLHIESEQIESVFSTK